MDEHGGVNILFSFVTPFAFTIKLLIVILVMASQERELN